MIGRTQNGDCEEIANPFPAQGRRRRDWIDAHGSVPARHVVDASCGNRLGIALRHSHRSASQGRGSSANSRHKPAKPRRVLGGDSNL